MASTALIGAVAGVGILHTMVPDHWAPIALIARQQGWTRQKTAGTALKAGTGHVLSTLLIAAVVWIAGVAFAQRFGHYVDTASSIALIGLADGLRFHRSWKCEARAATRIATVIHTHTVTAITTTTITKHICMPTHATCEAENIVRHRIAADFGLFAYGRRHSGFFCRRKIWRSAHPHYVCGLRDNDHRYLCRSLRLFDSRSSTRNLGPSEKYGEVLSGAFIALVGIAFWVWPVL